MYRTEPRTAPKGERRGFGRVRTLQLRIPDDAHPSIRAILRHLEPDDDLEEPLNFAELRRTYFEVGVRIATALSGPEVTVAVRKLVESYDASRRAMLDGNGTQRQENAIQGCTLVARFEGS